MSEDTTWSPTASDGSAGGYAGAIRSAARRADVATGSTRSHPGDEYEALPDDAIRPEEITIRPRYEGTTAAWVSAPIGDTVSLLDHC
jgi:hypothetical protein